MARNQKYPDWFWYQEKVESLINSYIKYADVGGYSSITGENTSLNVSVGSPDSHTTVPRIDVWLSAIQDDKRTQSPIGRSYTNIGTKVHEQPVEYLERLGFTIEVHTKRYSDTIRLMESIKKGFKPNTTINIDYMGKTTQVPTSLSDYELSVLERNGQIEEYIGSYMLSLHVVSQPSEEFRIGTTGQIDNISVNYVLTGSASSTSTDVYSSGSYGLNQDSNI